MMQTIPQGFNSLMQNKTLSQFTIPLVGIGAELLTFGNVDEAMELFQTAHHLLRDPSPSVCEYAVKYIQQGSQQLLRQSNTPVASKGKLDLYLEDDVEAGPQMLDSPVRVDYIAGVTEQDQILLESILLCNIALAHHTKENYSSAQLLYKTVTESVQNLIRSRGPTPNLVEMGMRAYNNLGQILYFTGDEDLALVQFQYALMYAQQLAASSRSHRLEYAVVLSNRCRCQWTMGDISSQLVSSLREILRIRTTLMKSNDLEVASAHYNLAVAEYARNNWKSAEMQFHHYLNIARDRNASQGVEDIEQIPAVTYLLLIQNENNDDNVAQDLVRGLRTLQDKRQDAGSRSLEVASVMNFIGTLLFHRQDYENALVFFHAELKIEEALKKNENDISIAVTCNNVGRILQELGKWHEAIQYYQRALASEYGDVISNVKDSSVKIPVDMLGNVDASSVNLYSTVWYNLGLIHDKLGAYEDAIRAFRMSLALRKEMLGAEHPDIACLLYNIGVLQMEQQHVNDAHRSFQEALRIRRLGNSGQLNDQQIVKTLEKLASLLKASGKVQNALDTLLEVLKIHESSSEHDEPSRCRHVGVSLRSIAELHQTTGDIRSASEYGWKSVICLRGVYDSTAVGSLQRFEVVEQLASSYLLVGSVYHEDANSAKANQVYEEAHEILRETCVGSNSPSLNALRDVVRMLATVQCAPMA